MAAGTAVQPPPFDQYFFALDPQTGKPTQKIDRRWQDFLLNLQRTLNVNAAPTDGPYLTWQADSRLSNDRNLGLLISGYLKITVAAGAATPSSTATLAAADLTGALPALNAAALTNLNASALASGTVPDARFPATLPAINGSQLTNLTGANVNHSTVTKTFADTGYVAALDQTVWVNATAGATTIKLPGTAESGKSVTVKKIDASVNAVTIDGNGHNVDGAATQALPLQWNSFTVQGDGTNWFITAKV